MTLTDAALAAAVAAEAGELLLAMRAQVGYGDLYHPDNPHAGFDPYDSYALGDAGDKRANALILDRLHRERPHDAVLSEEAVDDVSRVDADRVWIVDPVDGTHEYSMPGRTDWAVHIALWQRVSGSGVPDSAGRSQALPPAGGGTITDAAVALPARGEVYRTDTVRPPQPRADGPIRITASSNRPPAVLWRLREQLDIQLVRIGSAGAKAMAVVRGDADAYVHAGGQWEWDSAAPAGVLWAAGMHASRLDGSPLVYNRRNPYLPDLLMCRPEISDVLLEVIRSARGAR